MNDSVNTPDDPDSQYATSMSLLQLARTKDQHAWTRLSELYAPLIYHWCRRSGIDADTSADLVQDVFRSVVLHLDRFEKSSENGSFRGWLWTITRNRIRDHIRRQGDRARGRGGSAAQVLIENIPEEEPTDSSDSAISPSGSLTYRALHIVRGEVKETTWLAFWRTTIDEVSPVAVAEELSISIDSVWQAKSRVMRRLRELLE